MFVVVCLLSRVQVIGHGSRQGFRGPVVWYCGVGSAGIRVRTLLCAMVLVRSDFLGSQGGGAVLVICVQVFAVLVKSARHAHDGGVAPTF